MELSLKTEKDDGRFLFSALSYQKDIVLPTFSDQRHLDWVKYGDDNMFPNELLTLFNKSGIHNAIIESKVRMMAGDGIKQDEEEGGYSEKTQSFIDQVNQYENMDKVYQKCSMDYELYGLAYLEVIWGKGRKQVAELHHIDATKIRWGKMNDKNRIETFYYSRDWNNYRKEQYQPIEIPLFNDKGSSARQIIPIIRYTPGLDYYSYPDYIASTKWVAIDTEIANFHFNNLKNGMTPSIFFGFPVGDTTNEERETIDEKIREKYAGTNNASKFILAFYDAEGDKKPEVTILESPNADKMYDLLNKTTLQQILIGHKVVNENLVGISTPGKLGSSSEILQNYELYFNTVIKPEQSRVLEQFQRVMLINGMNDIYILDNKPLSMEFSENVMKEILTRDEMREIVGYEPIEDDEIVSDDEIIDEIIPEEEILEEGNKISIRGQQYNIEMAGVRTIDATNAAGKVGEANLDDTYMWRMAGGEVCPSCLSYNGKTRTLDRWLKWAIPGQQSGTNYGNGRTYTSPFTRNARTTRPGVPPFGTYCEEDCQCKLVKVGRIK